MLEEFLPRTLAELFQLLHKVYQRVSGKYQTISFLLRDIIFYVLIEGCEIYHIFMLKKLAYTYMPCDFVDDDLDELSWSMKYDIS